MSQIYLLHGDNEARINDAKRALIAQHLSPEQRAHNYSEFAPIAPRWSVSLDSIMADLISELAMASFLPEAKRVVVVYNLAELYQKSRKASDVTKSTRKTESMRYFLDFLAGPFRHEANVLIFVTVEDHPKRRTLNKKSLLYALVKKSGIVQEMSEKRLAYRLSDALLRQDTSACIRIFRQWFPSYDKARQDIFRCVLDTVHLLVQAKILNAKQAALKTDTRLSTTLFPKEFTKNILQQHPYRRKKFQDAASPYSTSQLTYALKYLLRLNAALYPVQQDRYVPDHQLMFEVFFLCFTTQNLNPDQRWGT